jgi:hypothetical protein
MPPHAGNLHSGESGRQLNPRDKHYGVVAPIPGQGFANTRRRYLPSLQIPPGRIENTPTGFGKYLTGVYENAVTETQLAYLPGVACGDSNGWISLSDVMRRSEIHRAATQAEGTLR